MIYVMMPFYTAPPMCLERREGGVERSGRERKKETWRRENREREREREGERERERGREKERERERVSTGERGRTGENKQAELCHNALQCTMTEYYSIPVERGGSMLAARAM